MILRAEQPFLIPEAAPPAPPTTGLTPRGYQVEGIEAARRFSAEGIKRILLVLATGGGKTVVAALVALGAVAKGKRVLFVGPRREIIAQAFWKLVEAGIPELSCGVVMADGIIPHATRQPYDARRPHAPVQVASVQTLANRKPPPADVVFIDEAHHATSETWARIIEHYTGAGAVVVGLTATPCRADGAGLGKLFDRLHVIASFADLAAQGYLVVPRVFTTPCAPDLSRVRLTESGDYDQKQLAATMRTRALVGDVVEHWQRHAEGRTTVVFAASVEHSRDLRDAFRAAGVTADHIDANTDPVERDAALSRLARGETMVLCNMQVVTEGWDLPRCKCVVLARPTKSLSLMLQMAGRGLRPWQDVSAILLDHAGAVHEHGFPSDEREWSLEGRVKRKGTVSVRTCDKCYAALPGGTPVCSECGHVFPIEEREVPDVVDGQLLEARPISRAEKVTWYRGTLAEAVAAGRKLGWARHRFKEQFGAWPRFGAVEREFYTRTPEGDWLTREQAEAYVDELAAGPLPGHEARPSDLPPTPSAEIAPLRELGIERAAATPIAPPVRARTWRELAALGAEVGITPALLVTVRAPADVAPDLRAAIGWRVEAMRAQLRARAGIDGRVSTLVAVPGLELPLGPLCRWRGPRQNYGRTVWVSLEAQRPLPGLCPSCGDAQERAATGDCMLCNAARAEGVLGAPSTWTPPPPSDEAAWRAELRAAIARPDPLPPPPAREPWTCEVCGAVNLARRDVEGCGRCELKAADVLSLAKLGGGVAADEDEEVAFE